MLDKALLVTTLLLSASAALAAEQAGDAAAGVWQTKSGGYVQVYRQKDHWVGRIVGSASGKARYDENNPDESKRGRRLLGVTVLRGLTYDGDGQYSGGTIYDPNGGKTYSAKATLKSRDKLDIRGYIGFSLIGKTQTWTRVSPDAEHVHQDMLRDPAGP